MSDDKTPAESPKSILQEIKTLERITQNVADRAIEIQSDIKLIFERQDKTDNRIAITFGIACSALAVSLFALFMTMAKHHGF